MPSEEDERVHSAATLQALPEPVTEGIPSGARRIGFLAALLVVPAALAGAAVGGLPVAGSIVAGGFISLLNFWVLSRLVVVTTSPDDLSTSKLVFQLMSKLGVLGVLLGGAVFGLGLDPVGLVLGLGVTIAAVPLNLFSDWMAAR